MLLTIRLAWDGSGGDWEKGDGNFLAGRPDSNVNKEPSQSWCAAWLLVFLERRVCGWWSRGCIACSVPHVCTMSVGL